MRLVNREWSSISEAQGLPSHSISSMLDDGLGYWWLASNRGIIRASRKELGLVADGVLAILPCQVFNQSDGLASGECPVEGYQTTGLKDAQGRLWFATLKGVAMVDPARVRINTNPPPVIIEGFGFMDASGVGQQLSLAGTQPVLVPPGSREVNVHFAGLSLSAPVDPWNAASPKLKMPPSLATSQ